MNKLKSRIQLLSLFSIFFVYSAIKALFNNNPSEFFIWLLITAIYIVSLVILYFVVKNWQKEQTI
ncbi:MAG: hypothetical protein ACFFC9_13115 [Promethearchaeota archaeon]